jgi:hypothetical protein
VRRELMRQVHRIAELTDGAGARSCFVDDDLRDALHDVGRLLGTAITGADHEERPQTVHVQRTLA